MSLCFVCERKITKKNNKCSSCNKCWFCHCANPSICRFSNIDGHVGLKPTCSICKDLITTKNPKCKYCTTCLGCHAAKSYNDLSMQGFNSCIFTTDPTLILDKKSKTSHFKCPRLVGVEWEYSKFKDKKALLNIVRWVTKNKAGHKVDGSCMGEIVTAPIAGDNIRKQLSELGDIIKHNTVVDNKCGIHVHVDARDVDENSMKRVLSLYKKVEPLLYLLGGIDRAKSTYCKPLKNMSRPTERYYGINISNWELNRSNSKKTIEFRLHQGTNDSERVIHWAQLCATLVDYAIKSNTRKINLLPSSAIKIVKKLYPQGSKWVLDSLQKYRKEYKSNDRHFSLLEGKWQWKTNKPRPSPARNPIIPIPTTTPAFPFTINYTTAE